MSIINIHGPKANLEGGCKDTESKVRAVDQSEVRSYWCNKWSGATI